MPDRLRIAAAAVAVICALAGAIAVMVAVAAGPSPGWTGYVSEAGGVANPLAETYRIGVSGLAVALLSLAASLPSTLRIAAALLGASGVTTAGSAAVGCSDGCPLPPYESATVADLVHGAASIVAVATCVFAMLAVAVAPTAGRPVRLVSAVAAGLALPLSAVVAVAMLAVGRGLLIGVTERILLADGVAWLVATALLLATDRRRATRTPVLSARPPR